jgi:hypothetical protein
MLSLVKLNKKDNQLDYIVYSDAKMKVLNDWNCHVKEVEEEAIAENNTNSKQRSKYTKMCYHVF